MSNDNEQAEAEASVIDLDVQLKELVGRVDAAASAGDTSLAVDVGLLKTITSMAVEGMTLTTLLAQHTSKIEFNGAVDRVQALGQNPKLVEMNVRRELMGHMGGQFAKLGLCEFNNGVVDGKRIYQIAVYVISPQLGPGIITLKERYEAAQKAKAAQAGQEPPQG